MFDGHQITDELTPGMTFRMSESRTYDISDERISHFSPSGLLNMKENDVIEVSSTTRVYKNCCKNAVCVGSPTIVGKRLFVFAHLSHIISVSTGISKVFQKFC